MKRNLSFIKPLISLWKYVNTAANDPICRLTSIDRLWSLKFKKSENIIKWEEELIGKNSVTPCIRDKINISITVLK